MITEGQRAKLPTSAFGLPERRCYPVLDDATALQARADAAADNTAGLISKAQLARISGAVDRYERRMGRKRA